MATDTPTDSQTIALLRTLIAALEEKKAADLKVLHVGGVSDITDYLVLATGNSEPHLRALRIEAEKVLDAAKIKIAGLDQGGFGSGWTVLDAYQIMVHLFTAEQRGNYALEKLWKDAPDVDLKTLDAKPVTRAKPKGKKAAASAASTPVARRKTKAPAAADKAPRSRKKPTQAPAKSLASKLKSAPAKSAAKKKKPAAK